MDEVNIDIDPGNGVVHGLSCKGKEVMIVIDICIYIYTCIFEIN